MINPRMEKKVKEIVGDSTGKEAAEKIMKWLQENSNYGYYYLDGYSGKTLRGYLEYERMKSLNCEDERVTRIKKHRAFLLSKGIKYKVLK